VLTITSKSILEKLNAYLNQEITLAQLVDWAETGLIDPEIPERENVDLIMDTLMYIGAADSAGFPLTWDVLTEFFEKLGGKVRVIVEVVA